MALIPSMIHSTTGTQKVKESLWHSASSVKGIFKLDLYMVLSTLFFRKNENPFGFLKLFVFFVVHCNNFVTDMELIGQAVGPWCDSPGQ